MNSVSTQSATDSSAGFQTVRNKKSKKHYKKCAKNGELWSPAKGWLRSYRCAACHNVMSRKEAPKCPHIIHNCGHITCANCIVKSYLVELNPLCPVEGCGKCVNPKQKQPTLPVKFLEETPSVSPITAIEETNETEDKPFETYNLPSYEEFEYEPVDASPLHYCGDAHCDWDCGVLWCGCIDVCRGRCGVGDGCRDRWW